MSETIQIEIGPKEAPTHCSTYTFPEVRLISSAKNRGHSRSISHGGGTTFTGSNSAGINRPSALKGSRGHQRALSQGQITDTIKSGVGSGHSRVGSKTDFILPPGHKFDNDTTATTTTNVSSSAKGHSRQASRSESIYTLRRTAPPPIWRRLLCLLLRRRPKYEPEERFRIVVPNHLVPPKTPRKEHPNGKRPNNKIRTTKYTLLSFLPRNLLEQFHRVANLYFIFIVLLNWFPAINAFGKEIAMIPVMFVLGVTAVKDLFEDRRRHVSDKRINNSTCRIYQSEAARYKKVLWKEVRVGDLIHLSNNEVVPADILLLRSSDPNGLCYIDTGHLDGETNLKQRQVPRGFVEKQNLFEPSKFRSRIEVEAPTTKIYRFHGAIIHPSGEKIPIGTDNVLLRECLLKNTDFIEGIVVYAGHETKAMLNNGGPRYKRSSLERQMNQDVLWCVLILIVLCLIGAIGCKLWLNAYDLLESPFRLGNSDTTEAILAFWTYVIVLQIMIPLSLYVTLELCKIIQVYHIHHNVDLYDELVDKRTECRALNITEELGQIQYIFSDKTGTLTENRMIFRRCTIAGVDYNHPNLKNDGKNVNKLGSGSLSVLTNPRLIGDLNQDALTMSEFIYTTRQNHAAKIQEFLLLLTLCNTVICSNHPHYDLMNESGIIESLTNNIQYDMSNGSSTTSTINNDTNDNKYLPLNESRSVTPSPPLNFSLNNKSIISLEYKNLNIQNNSITTVTPINATTITTTATTTATTTTTTTESTTTISKKEPLKRPKLLSISPINLLSKRNENKIKLNKSLTPSPNDLKPIFEAESPDELALVDASYNYNCKLLKRTPTNISIDYFNDGRINFELLHVLPFDSIRKRMSVIIKNPLTNEITLYCKGADTSIFPHLIINNNNNNNNNNNEDEKLIISKTQQHINNYAKNGLRVLVMAKRILTQQEYNEWNERQLEINSSFDNLEKKLQDNYSKIENNLTLIGATGIEDRLQDGVPETLSSLISAGIIVWVLTGDKPETAINIAYSSKLFSHQMDLLKLMCRSKETAETTIHFYLNEIEKKQQTTSSSQSTATTITTTSSTTLNGSRKLLMKQLNFNNGKALIVDGKTLTFILDRRSNLTKPFLKLTTYCSSVLCCRATPLQKAYIVRIVKEYLKMRTLAIGDGANDVSMIQTADVGIGISGQEGMQAVMAADFSLSRFKYLERLLLVHGHWSYDRLSRMVLYFFYKNAAFVFLVFWYQLYCGFSGAVMIDQMYLMLYNLLFTSLPPIAIGVYDRDAPEDLLIDNPYLYRKGRLGRVYRSYSFWLTMADAVYQSLCIFFICLVTYADTDIDIFEFGTTATTACMFVMLLHVAIEIKSWTIIHVGAIFLSIGAFYIYSFLYNTLCTNCFGLPSTYWIIQKATMRPTYWLITLLSTVIALLPRYIFRILKYMLAPDDISRAIRSKQRTNRRGEGFLVSWSRSTSTSSIHRTSDNRNKNNTLTAVE